MADVGEEHILIPCYNKYGNVYYASNSGEKMEVGDEVVVFGVRGKKYALKPCPVFEKGKDVACFGSRVTYWKYHGDDVIVIPAGGVDKTPIVVADIPNYGLLEANVAPFDYVRDAGTDGWAAVQNGSVKYNRKNSTVTLEAHSEIVADHNFDPVTNRFTGTTYYGKVGLVTAFLYVDCFAPITGYVIDATWSGAPKSNHFAGRYVNCKANLSYGMNVGWYGTRYRANPTQGSTAMTGLWGDNADGPWDSSWVNNSMHRVLNYRSWGIKEGAAIGGIPPDSMGITKAWQKRIIGFKLGVDAELIDSRTGGSGYSVSMTIKFKTYR